MSGSTERQSPKLWAGMLSHVWVPRRVSFGPDTDPAGFPRPSVFLSSLFLSSSSLHSLRLVSSPWGHLLFPGSLQSKRDNLCDDLSTSQGGGRKHGSDQCFCNLYNRATNPYNSAASLPASNSGRRWRGRSHRSHWNLARSSFLPTLFSPRQPQHNVLAPTT